MRHAIDVECLAGELRLEQLAATAARAHREAENAALGAHLVDEPRALRGVRPDAEIAGRPADQFVALHGGRSKHNKTGSVRAPASASNWLTTVSASRRASWRKYSSR